MVSTLVVLVIGIYLTVAQGPNSVPDDYEKDCHEGHEASLEFFKTYGSCMTEATKKELGFVPADRKNATIVLELGPLASSQMSTLVAAYLLQDAMGYKIKLRCSKGATGSLVNLNQGKSDILMEHWARTVLGFVDEQLLYSASNVTPMGSIGFEGLSGLYVPSYVRYPERGVPTDSWKQFQIDSVVQYFTLQNESALLKDLLPYRREYNFTPPWCLPWDPTGERNNCLNIKVGDENFERGRLQQLIINKNLKITLSYWGYFYLDLVVDKFLRSQKPVLFVTEEPSLLYAGSIAGFEMFQRIALPTYRPSCDSNNTLSLEGVGGFDCDFPLRDVLKVANRRVVDENFFPNRDAKFRDVARFLKAFRISFLHMVKLLNYIPYNSFAAKACSEVNLGSGNKFASFVYNDYEVFDFEMDPMLSSIIFILAILALVITASLASFYFRHRYHASFRMISARFSLVLFFGFFVVIISALFLIAQPTTARCAVVVWFPAVGLFIVVSNMALKTFRLYKVFTSHSANVKDNYLLKLQAIGMLIVLGVLVIKQLLSPAIVASRVEEFQVSPPRMQQVSYCQSEMKYFAAVGFVNGLVLLYTAVLIYKLRHIDSHLSEKKAVAKMVSITVLSCATAFPIASFLWEARQYSMSLFIQGLMLTVTPVLLMLQLFGSRVLKHLSDKRESANLTVDQLSTLGLTRIPTSEHSDDQHAHSSKQRATRTIPERKKNMTPSEVTKHVILASRSKQSSTVHAANVSGTQSLFANIESTEFELRHGADSAADDNGPQIPALPPFPTTDHE